MLTLEWNLIHIVYSIFCTFFFQYRTLAVLKVGAKSTKIVFELPPSTKLMFEVWDLIKGNESRDRTWHFLAARTQLNKSFCLSICSQFEIVRSFKFPKVFRGPPKFTRVSHGSSKLLKVSKHFQKVPQSCTSLPEVPQGSAKLPKAPWISLKLKVPWSSQTFPEVSSSLFVWAAHKNLHSACC